MRNFSFISKLEEVEFSIMKECFSFNFCPIKNVDRLTVAN